MASFYHYFPLYLWSMIVTSLWSLAQRGGKPWIQQQESRPDAGQWVPALDEIILPISSMPMTLG